MQETIKNQEYLKIFNAKFSSMGEFLTYIRTTPKITYADDSETGDYYFTGTYSLDQALDMCENGYFDKMFSIFKNLILKSISNLTKDFKNNGVKNDVLGFAPNVPYFLQGNPLNMFNSQRIERVARALKVELHYNVSESARVAPKEIIKKGLIFLALFELLKKLNMDVNILFTDVTKYNSNIIKVDVDIQRGNGFNLNELYFPLVHPSFLRRLIFAYDERCPFLKDKQSFFSGYGKPESIRACMDDNDSVKRIISSDYCYYNDLYDLFVMAIEELEKKGIINKKILIQLLANLKEIKEDIDEFDKQL